MTRQRTSGPLVVPLLRAAELTAWRRWRPNDTVAQVLAFRRRSGAYPVIQGGRHELRTAS